MAASLTQTLVYSYNPRFKVLGEKYIAERFMGLSIRSDSHVVKMNVKLYSPYGRGEFRSHKKSRSYYLLYWQGFLLRPLTAGSPLTSWKNHNSKSMHGCEKNVKPSCLSIRNVISNFGEFYHTSYTSMIWWFSEDSLILNQAKRAGKWVKQEVTLLILNHLKARLVFCEVYSYSW